MEPGAERPGGKRSAHLIDIPLPPPTKKSQNKHTRDNGCDGARGFCFSTIVFLFLLYLDKSNTHPIACGVRVVFTMLGLLDPFFVLVGSSGILTIHFLFD